MFILEFVEWTYGKKKQFKKEMQAFCFVCDTADIGKDSRVNRTQRERGLVYRKWHLSGPLIIRLPVKDASINKEGKC